MAKSPSERPASAAALKQALERVAEHAPHDPAAAKRWWQERAPALRAARAVSGSLPPGASMTIDLLGRAPPSS